MKGRSHENRPALRDHLDQYEKREWGEHPDGEKDPQEQRRMTCLKHQTDRADGASDYGDQGRCAKEVGFVVQRRPQSIAAAWLIQFSEAAQLLARCRSASLNGDLKVLEELMKSALVEGPHNSVPRRTTTPTEK